MEDKKEYKKTPNPTKEWDKQVHKIYQEKIRKNKNGKKPTKSYKPWFRPYLVPGHLSKEETLKLDDEVEEGEWLPGYNLPERISQDEEITRLWWILTDIDHYEHNNNHVNQVMYPHWLNIDEEEFLEWLEGIGFTGWDKSSEKK